MKILYIITKSGSGGAQTHVVQLVNYMRGQGHEVAVVSHPDGMLRNRVEKAGAKFYPNPFFSNRYDPFAGFSIMRVIRSAVNDFKPDVISLHSSAAGFWGRLAIRSAVPTVFTAHGWGFTDGVPSLRKMIAIISEKVNARFSDKIICVSENDRTLALRYAIADAEKMLTIHNGVEDLSLLLKKDSPQDPEGKLRIVFVGRLDAPKRPELLIRVFAGMPKEFQEKASVVIIGDGAKRAALEKLLSESGLSKSVRLLGDLPREKVLEALSDGFNARCRENTVFALISDYEGFPISILEAMGFGLAVIASDVGGIREAVDGATGVLVPRGDTEMTASALRDFLDHPEKIARLGDAAHERMIREFSLAEMFRKTETVYDEIVAR